jgi:hypothetical protein
MRSVYLRPCVCISVAFSFVLASAASAATVTSVSGKVSINRGSGFAQISSGTSVKPGDTVMAGPSGQAEIVYDNGCRQKVEPGSVVVVAESPVGGGGLKDSPRCQTAEVPRDHLLLAAAVAGGIGAGIYFATQGPASP